MPKVKLVIIATIVAWTGFELNQTATATQFSAQSMTGITHLPSVVTDARSRSISGREYLSLAKKCTIRRYRRPR
jgi:hypothetical protein